MKSIGKKLLKCIYYSIVLFRNSILSHVPSRSFRKFIDCLLGVKIGKASVICRRSELIKPICLAIGHNTNIGFDVKLDARGGIEIGNNVCIASGVKLMTGGHEIDSSDFKAHFKPITVRDRVWLCENSFINPGVTIGEGAVVLSGAVVTKDVEPFTVVGGNPARYIKNRRKELSYTLGKTPPLH